MKKIFKSRIFLVILTAIITTSIIGVSASILYQANEIGFTPRNSNWKVNNLESALNDLYNKAGNSCETTNNVYQFEYKGDVYTFDIPASGTYKLEVWGAQGGDNPCLNLPGGKGGYAIGYKEFNKDDKIYIYVGGKGQSINGNGDWYGGYNGGGGIRVSSIESTCDKNNGTGGGATDIALVSSAVTQNSTTLRTERTEASYNSRIIVAGGGGGSGDLYHVKSVVGGYGGGLTGGGGRPGTQSGTNNLAPNNRVASPGKGLGGSGYAYSGVAAVTGGGAGYYGGDYSRANANVSNTIPSGGGSSYIGGVTSYGNNVALTISGDSLMPDPYQGTETGHSGNGFAKITYVGN